MGSIREKEFLWKREDLGSGPRSVLSFLFGKLQEHGSDILTGALRCPDSIFLGKLNLWHQTHSLKHFSPVTPTWKWINYNQLFWPFRNAIWPTNASGQMQCSTSLEWETGPSSCRPGLLAYTQYGLAALGQRLSLRKILPSSLWSRTPDKACRPISQTQRSRKFKEKNRNLWNGQESSGVGVGGVRGFKEQWPRMETEGRPLEQS